MLFIYLFISDNLVYNHASTPNRHSQELFDHQENHQDDEINNFENENHNFEDGNNNTNNTPQLTSLLSGKKSPPAFKRHQSDQEIEQKNQSDFNFGRSKSYPLSNPNSQNNNSQNHSKFSQNSQNSHHSQSPQKAAKITGNLAQNNEE